MITVPDEFARSTIFREGEDGRRWLAALPQLVHTYSRQWQLSIDGPVLNGYFGLVVPVRRGDELCVLKLSWVNETTINEMRAMAIWNGSGVARLLETDPAQGAMLLERLDFRRTLNEVSIGEALTICGRLCRRLAIPTSAVFPTQQRMAGEIAESLPGRWQLNGRPFSRRILDKTCEFARQLAGRSGELLINYDIHYDDVLAAEREPWLAVDPKVVLGEVAFGLAQLLWCRLEDIEADGGLDVHFQILVEAAEIEPELTAAWTLVRTVDYWLWGLSVGLTEDPPRCEKIVNWLS